MVITHPLPADNQIAVKDVFELKQTIRVIQNGANRTDAILSGCHGDVRCRFWESVYSGSEFYGRRFQCKLLLEQNTGRHTKAILECAKPIEDSEVTLENQWRKLTIPIADTMDQVKSLIERCPIDQLKLFIRDVLSDPLIAQPFFMLPASHDYHHDYPGGLAVHSIEAANIALSAIPMGSDVEVSLTLTAALFHDIGKTRTLNSAGRKTVIGRVIRHEQLNLECLAKPMQLLEKTWPDGATALRFLLTYAPEQQKRPLLPCAMAVHYADRMSASLAARAKSLSRQPANVAFSSTYAKGPKSWFWHPQINDVPGRRKYD